MREAGPGRKRHCPACSRAYSDQAMDRADDATAGLVRERESSAWLALPVLASFATYAVVLTGGFVWDDFFLIVNSPSVTGHGSWTEHFTQPFSSNPLQEARSFYRPLITLSYWLDQRLWGGWPGGFHLTNLALHIAFVLLLFAMIRRAGAGRQVAAWLATLFALAPRLSESVAWISGRTDIAAGIAVLAAMLVFKAGPGGRLRRSLSGVLIMVGLLCKEVVVAGAVALALFAWLEARKPRSVLRWFFDTLPVTLAMAAYTVIRGGVMSGTVDKSTLSGRDSATAVVLTFEAIARYVWMVLTPLQPRLQIGNSNRPSILIGGVGALLAVSGTALVWKKRHRGSADVWMALALGATSIALVLPAMPLDLNVTAADRFLYLPLAALALLLARPAQRLWQRRRPGCLMAVGVLVVAFALVTSFRARRWAAEIPLWREAVAQSSTDQPVPRVELSAALMRRGRYREALSYLEQVAGSQRLAIAVNLGTCLDKLGHREAAIREVEPVVQQQPWRVNARVTLMLLHARALRFDVAARVGQSLLVDFPHRRDLPQLVAQIDRTMAEMQALPPIAPTDGAAPKAQKATLYDRLGALPEAQALWRMVALDGAADVELRLRGAAYIAAFGNPDIARETLDQLSQQPFAQSQMPTLLAALEARLEDG